MQGLFNTVSAIYGKFADTKLGMRQADSTDAKTAADIIKYTNDDVGLQILRDAALVMPIAWSGLMGWDTIVAVRYPWLMFHVANYPTSVQYLPYGAWAFLFGILGLQIWKRQ